LEGERKEASEIAMSATPFATYYYGRGALLGHSLMQPPAPHH
jgi:hypothetical protein